MKTKLGAHLSIAGGYEKALQSIADKGGNSLQIFSASPRGWNFAKPTQEQINIFLSEKHRLQIDPVYFHASYLINMADNGFTGKNSVKILINELNLAPQMEVRGSIIHLGSFKEHKEKAVETLSLLESESPASPTAGEKFEVLITNIKEVLDNTPNNTYFIIENAGNRKIGQSIEQIAQIIETVDNDRVKVCLDTCHAHAAGYNLNDPESFDKFFEDFDRNIGLERLEIIHVNDSRDPFGSLRDRHANIGQGEVGVQTFKNLLNSPLTKNLSFIIETPGFDDKGPDKQNLDILKGYILS